MDTDLKCHRYICAADQSCSQSGRPAKLYGSQEPLTPPKTTKQQKHQQRVLHQMYIAQGEVDRRQLYFVADTSIRAYRLLL